MNHIDPKVLEAAKTRITADAAEEGSLVLGGSRHMRVASMISMVIADAKQQKEIQLRDVVAAIYVANFERILRFWPNAAVFEDFIAEHCGWSEHRLTTWDRWTYNTNHPPRTVTIPFSRRFFQTPRKHTIHGKTFKESEDLKHVISTAAKLTPNKVESFGRALPLITPELFLFATTRTEDVELSGKLANSGLRLDLLEEAALERLESPEKLRF